ncbi:MAG: tRNA pseudouridine(54/55) synthase Pus10 [Candidatus Ranarchaeia archaeon]
MTQKKPALQIIEEARNLLGHYALCDHCLGRQFALLGTETNNRDRGTAIKLILTMSAQRWIEEGTDEEGEQLLRILSRQGGYSPARAVLIEKGFSFEDTAIPCYICHNVFDQIPNIVSKALGLLKEIEYNSFLVGSKIPPDMIEREDQMRMQQQLSWGEAIKREINREFGKAFAVVSGKNVDFERPDVTLIWDLERNSVEVTPSPCFIYGRYRKLIRGIPQTRWPCRNCGGKGCEECKGTGKRYQTSVEEQIRGPIIAAFKASTGKFHGAGREDIDARMLGEGRPFVFEVIKPHVRSVDLDRLAKEINMLSSGKVEVSSLRYSNMETMRRLKAFAAYSSKTYKALIRVEHPIQEHQLLKMDETLTGAIIQQRTPNRVKHRRSDRLRNKKVYWCRSTFIDEKHFISEIHCQGGLYIKELVSGDEGQTTPNMSTLLGVSAICEELDVTQVNTEVPDNGKKPARP